MTLSINRKSIKQHEPENQKLPTANSLSHTLQVIIAQNINRLQFFRPSLGCHIGGIKC